MAKHSRLVIATLLTGTVSCMAVGKDSSTPEPAKHAAPVQVQATRGAMDAIVASERAFAQVAQDSNVREAFISFLSDEAIIFSPGPVKGREHWQKRPAPPPREAGKAPPRSLLWAPVLGDVSAAGDMGYSTGPFILRDNTGKAADVHGLFFSIWKQEPNGDWRVALDIGVSTPQPAYALGDAFQRAPAPARPPSESAPADLKKLDSEFAAISLTKPVQAFDAYFAQAGRLHHEGHMPLTKKEELIKYADMHVVRYTMEPMFADLSSSRDFGYTYGTYQLLEKGKPGSGESGHYTRVWRLQSEGWRIVAEIMLPAPPKE